MQELISNLSRNQGALVLAPPGFGKTYQVLQSLLKTDVKIIFIFPLRALAEEVLLEGSKANLRVADIKNSEGNEKLIVATAECFNIYGVKYNFKDYVFVIDEFHLVYSWGESFRFELIRCWESIASLYNPVLLLSATMKGEYLQLLKNEVELNFDRFDVINQGNLTLRNYPQKVFYYPRNMRDILISKINFLRTKGGTVLIFCKYRNEVLQLARSLQNAGHKVISCVGGEAKFFMAQLSKCKKWDYIVATSVVSHGVNLPKVEHVLFTYEVTNLDQYLQMVGRGGRDGSPFICSGMNKELMRTRDLLHNYIFLGIELIKAKIRAIQWI